MTAILPERARRFVPLEELKRDHVRMLLDRGEELIRLRSRRHDLATELVPVERKRARLLAAIEAVDREIGELDKR